MIIEKLKYYRPNSDSNLTDLLQKVRDTVKQIEEFTLVTLDNPSYKKAYKAYMSDADEELKNAKDGKTNRDLSELISLTSCQIAEVVSCNNTIKKVYGDAVKESAADGDSEKIQEKFTAIIESLLKRTLDLEYISKYTHVDENAVMRDIKKSEAKDGLALGVAEDMKLVFDPSLQGDPAMLAAFYRGYESMKRNDPEADITDDQKKHLLNAEYQGKTDLETYQSVMDTGDRKVMEKYFDPKSVEKVVGDMLHGHVEKLQDSLYKFAGQSAENLNKIIKEIFLDSPELTNKLKENSNIDPTPRLKDAVAKHVGEKDEETLKNIVARLKELHGISEKDVVTIPAGADVDNTPLQEDIDKD